MAINHVAETNNCTVTQKSMHGTESTTLEKTEITTNKGTKFNPTINSSIFETLTNITTNTNTSEFFKAIEQEKLRITVMLSVLADGRKLTLICPCEEREPSKRKTS
jgi:hypothetical protein